MFKIIDVCMMIPGLLCMFHEVAHEAARAGLASIENFSKVELRKTEPSIFPAALGARHNPFCDLMLLHVKGWKCSFTS